MLRTASGYYNPETVNGNSSNVFLVTKPQLPDLAPELDQLRLRTFMVWFGLLGKICGVF